MKLTYVKDLKADTPVHSTFLVQSKEQKTANNGAPYLDLRLRDRTGVVPGKLWDYSERTTPHFEADDFIEVDAAVELYRGSTQLKIRKVRLCDKDGVDLADYLPRCAGEPEEMYATLLARAGRLAEGPLRTLLMAVLEDTTVATRFKLAPAAMTYHHAFLGGLLEHVCSLVALADRVADHYPWLDRDLIVAGLLLHDLGKIEELEFARGFRYSTRGQLVGHMAIVLEMVQEKMRQIPEFPPPLKHRLEHIILSHHGQLEFGSPKEPMFAEASTPSGGRFRSSPADCDALLMCLS